MRKLPLLPLTEGLTLSSKAEQETSTTTDKAQSAAPHGNICRYNLQQHPKYHHQTKPQTFFIHNAILLSVLFCLAWQI